ncbi:T-cell surface glycoprotein CD3 epsilon chain [Syngnathus scovelli]|uniref:T-cell surface glycoprotein CD3 epsilon chain n=1 Tax=Syngnathus scovelli TaxID=161590 RepID=UPI0021103C65|nr:T-cell surface glycoprotein CD3 gamma chain [Syngnathus scovelli]XP_049581551.1 T-cell surface glycoprotein CD3 gamma chain [Syngnathus scovelli]
MKSYTVVSSFLVVWTLTEFVWCGEESNLDVKSGSAKITILCGKDKFLSKDGKNVTAQTLEYKDENSGEYVCVDQGDRSIASRIYVKFRTCDNCVELDWWSISSLAVGDLMATIVLGVGVYLVASRYHASVVSSQHRNSDRKHFYQHPNPNPNQIRVPNADYQELSHTAGHRQVYDSLNNK